MFLLFLLLAPFDIGTYSIEGETVSGPEFLRTAGWLMAIATVLCLSIAYALWRDRSWSRPLMILYWVVTGLAVLVWSREFNCAVVEMFIFAALAAWYLYGNHNAAAYYRLIMRTEDATVPQPPT